MIATSKTNYQRIAAEIDGVVARAPDCKRIHENLKAVFRRELRIHSKQPDWSESRSAVARLVLTNLAQLEAGIRLTAAATNISLMPPDLKVSGVGVIPPSDDLITDPADRERVKAYRAALTASSKLWNLHQALQAEHSRHSSDAVDLLVTLYSQTPSADLEVRQLLTTYANCNSAMEFSNRLHSLRK
jgi:hypothetical protein